MTIETLLQLDPRIWPIAVLAFMRILSILVWLPIFGDSVVPMRIKIMLAILMTVSLWTVIEKNTLAAALNPTGTAQNAISTGLYSWDFPHLLLLTMREVFFGFALGFAARTIVYGVSISSQLVGLSMGFQSASLFNPMAGHDESAFSAFQSWLLIVIVLALNIHHQFLIGIAKSFIYIPIGPVANDMMISRTAIEVVTTTFEMALRLAAPILVVQSLIAIAMGLMNRAVPQLNIFVMNFPISFLVSMMILFFSAGGFVRFIGSKFAYTEVANFEWMQKAFRQPEAK